jgi:hypothetical protein
MINTRTWEGVANEVAALYNRAAQEQEQGRAAMGVTTRARAGGAPITIGVWGRGGRVYLEGAMSDEIRAKGALPGSPLHIGFSDGTLLAVVWGREGEPQIRLLERGNGARLTWADGDGSLAKPASAVTVEAKIEWAMVGGCDRSRIVRPD